MGAGFTGTRSSGVGKGKQTQCEKVVSATLYGLGLSYDKASLVLGALGCGVVKATIWSNVQELGQKARRAFMRRQHKLGKRAGKIRHKSMRGYKSLRSSMLTTFLLASLAGVQAGVSYTSPLS